MNLNELSSRLNRISGKMEVAKKSIRDHRQERNRLSIRLKRVEEAVVVIQEVTAITHESIRVELETLITLAVQSIYGVQLKCVVEFQSKRNRTEVEIELEEDGVKRDVMEACGGGVVDIVALALRLTIWALSKPTPRPVLILDEPFRAVSHGLRSKVNALLSLLSKRLKMQFIIITHDPELSEEADRVLSVNAGKVEVIR